MSAKYHIVWNSGEGGGENYNIKWSNIQLLEEDEHGRGSWNLLNARQKPEQANLLISGYPDRNSTQLQIILWTAPLQHIRLLGIIGLLPPWPLMVPFNCHQSQRSPFFFHLVRKKTFRIKNTLVNSAGYDKPCSFTREDDKSFSTNNCMHRIDSRWHYPTTIQQINGPKRSKVSTITQLTRLKCKKEKKKGVIFYQTKIMLQTPKKWHTCMSKSDLPAMFKSAPEFHYFHSDVSDLVKFNISLIIIYTKIIFERRDDELHLNSQQLWRKTTEIEKTRPGYLQWRLWMTVKLLFK